MPVSYTFYSATGNTFLAFDNRQSQLVLSERALWEKVANDYGVDGLLFLEGSSNYDFKMRYLNRDGREVEMCGNGARAISVFAFDKLGLTPPEGYYQFETMNGVYQSKAFPPQVEMTELSEVGSIAIDDLYPALFSLYLNTGVPHCVYEVEDLEQIDIVKYGGKIREDRRFPEGTNVNFWQRKSGSSRHQFKLRSYERGVEGETLSCGTGAVATAVAIHHKVKIDPPIELHCLGGILTVKWEGKYQNISLAGNVRLIDQGVVDLSI